MLGAAKSNRKAIGSGSTLRSSIPNMLGHTKTNERIKKGLCNWIIQHPQVVQPPIENNCLKVYIYGNS